VSFSTLSNSRIEYITFDVVDMSYPYNTIFGRGFLNTFEDVLHSLYLCLMIPSNQGVISVHSNKKDARNIEQGFALGHKNVNCLQDEKTKSNNNITDKQGKGSFRRRPIEPKCEIKIVLLHTRVPDKMVAISQDLTQEEEKDLLSFLDKNNDVFAWRTSDITGASRDIIEHKLEVNPSARPKKQRLCKVIDENRDIEWRQENTAPGPNILCLRSFGQARTQADRTVRGDGKDKTRIISLGRQRRQGARAHMECRQPPLFFHLANYVTARLCKIYTSHCLLSTFCNFHFNLGPYSFSHRGNPQWSVVFNEAELLYLKASI
jgi:hypothetical protein